MRLAWLLALTALAQLPAAEVYRRLQPPLDERLSNAAIEQAEAGQLVGWNGYGAGYRAAPGAGRNATGGAVCQRTDPDGDATGLVQQVVLNQTHARPLVVTAWSRAQDVSGAADANYALYCDLVFADGTPLWGQSASFAVGTHDWARAEVLITPAKPVRSIAIYGLFRGHTGTVWFDDFSLGELGGDGIVMLDGVAVEPVGQPAAEGTAATWSGGPLSIRMAGSRVADVALNGRSQKAATATGGFLVRDVATDSGFHGFDGGEALGVKLTSSARTVDEAVRVEATITDSGTTDRALTFLFALPLEAVDWTWGRDADGAEPIAAAGHYGSFNSIEAGALGQLSNYPLANVAGPDGAVNLAIDPRWPALYRLGYSGSARLFYVAFDIALPSALLGRPASATVRFDIFPSDPAWGFRAALERFYQVQSDLYQVRCRDQGIWMAFAPISKVEGWEDFGFRYKEGIDETAWDDAHDIQTFRYSEMGTYWMAMPPELPRTYEQAVKLLEQRAAEGVPLAKATLTSGMQDREGRFLLLFKNAPWCDGAVFSLNPSPSLTGFTQAEVAGARRSRRPTSGPTRSSTASISTPSKPTSPRHSTSGSSISSRRRCR